MTMIFPENTCKIVVKFFFHTQSNRKYSEFAWNFWREYTPVRNLSVCWLLATRFASHGEMQQCSTTNNSFGWEKKSTLQGWQYDNRMSSSDLYSLESSLLFRKASVLLGTLCIGEAQMREFFGGTSSKLVQHLLSPDEYLCPFDPTSSHCCRGVGWRNDSEQFRGTFNEILMKGINIVLFEMIVLL